jgi:hypothetical protein
LEHFSLAVGLALRDISLAISKSKDGDLPAWISDSPLGERQIRAILKLCPPKIPENPETTGYVLL